MVEHNREVPGETNDRMWWFLNFWVLETLYTLTGTPESFCLCQLDISTFTIFKIKTEFLKYLIHLKITVWGLSWWCNG